MRMFITGTDTEVGKTQITTCLARSARRRGSVVAAKPVASGVSPGTPGEDATRLGDAAGHPPLTFATWPAPVSPHRAALIAGTPAPPDLPARIAALTGDIVLVEGVGGWSVPICLDPPLWVEDLARGTGGPVLVVAADRLGVLNHTLLTVAAIRHAGFRVAGVVLNRLPGTPQDASHASNTDDLRLLLRIPVVPVGPLPDDPTAHEGAGDEILRAIVEGSPPR